MKALPRSAGITGSSSTRGTTPPILHVIGGKITTYRKLAEAALKLLEPHLPPMRQGDTATTPLPGGDLRRPDHSTHGSTTLREAIQGFNQSATFVTSRAAMERVLSRIIDGATSERDLGEDFGDGLTAREVAYLTSEEWARTADDVLWRRTKTGLHLSPDDRLRAADRLQAYLDKIVKPREPLTSAADAGREARTSPDRLIPRTASDLSCEALPQAPVRR